MSGAEAAEMKLLMSGCVPSCVGVIHVCALVHICKFPSYMSVFKKNCFCLYTHCSTTQSMEYTKIKTAIV